MSEKNDISDQVRRGEGLSVVRSVKAGGDVVKNGSGFLSSASRVWSERDARLEEAERCRLTFGVKFLDDALGTIMPSDLLLIGAASGVGKTEMARFVAMHNASNGRRVHYLALEATKIEIERRIKFSFLKSIMQGCAVEQKKLRLLNFLDWMEGRLDWLTGPYERMADEAVQKKLSTLHTFYRVKDFTIDGLERLFATIREDTDLVVLDHLEFVESNDDNEHRGVRVIVRRIRDLAENSGKSVIVVAHVRKSDQGSDRLVPGLEDFSGTKAIGNMATKAVMIAPAFDQEQHEEKYRWKTYLSPVKCRVDGSRTRYTGLCTFNALTNTYERHYQLGRLVAKNTKFAAIDAKELPPWAADSASYELTAEETQSND